MQIRRLTAAAAAVLALAGLAGCRTSPNVAAYVGDGRITATAFEDALDTRLADEAVATYAAQDPAAYSDSVLTELVDERVHDIAAQRYGVEVDDGDVRQRLDDLLAGQDPEEVYARTAANNGLGRDGVFSSVRRQLIRLRIAEDQGLADGLSRSGLRAAYAAVRDQRVQYQLGYIIVPDQAAADAAVARLTGDPGAYADLAAQYPNQYTLTAPQTTTADKVPAELADQVIGADPGTAFSVPVDGVDGILVAFVADVHVPTFEELRPQLEQDATQAVDQKVAPLIADVRNSLEVTVNPRYGQWKDGKVGPLDSGVVDILGTEG